MADWQDMFEVEAGLSFDGITGVIPLADDPTLVLAGEAIPKSTVGIRKNPAGIWQKFGDGDFDWEQLGDSQIATFPDLFINVLLKNGIDVVKIPLNTDAKLPVMLRTGSTISVPIEV